MQKFISMGFQSSTRCLKLFIPLEGIQVLSKGLKGLWDIKANISEIQALRDELHLPHSVLLNEHSAPKTI